MSHFEAALQRAKSGATSPEPDLSPPAPSAAAAPADRALVPSRPVALASPVKTPTALRGAPRPAANPVFHGFKPADADKLIVSPALPHALRETYRRLAAMLHQGQADRGLKVLMISSAVPDEGKTLTATNIALTLSESYQRQVLLVDADLRRPSLNGLFQIGKSEGLLEALTSQPPRAVPVIRVSPHLSLLPAGSPHADPMSALTSDRMRQMLQQAAAIYDWVIIDTPPVGILTDAQLLSAMVDGAILVVRAGKTPATLVERAADSLGRDRILGVVLNRAEVRHATASYGGGYYSGDYYYYYYGGDESGD